MAHWYNPFWDHETSKGSQYCVAKILCWPSTSEFDLGVSMTCHQGLKLEQKNINKIKELHNIGPNKCLCIINF
jgi:hypothetical protein